MYLDKPWSAYRSDCESYAYWTVHHLDIWIKVDQLDVTNFIMSLFKNNQHDVTCGLSFIFLGSRHSLSTCFELSGSSKHVESEWRLPRKIKDSPQVTSCWLFLNNYNDARNNECKIYYVNFQLNMFQMLIQPSSGACNYLVCYCMGCIVLAWCVLVLCSGWAVVDVVSVCRLNHYHYTSGSTYIWIPHHLQPIRYITPTVLKPAQYSPCNNTPSSCKLLKMVVLTSETCWAEKWHNKISDIKLVYLYEKKRSDCVWDEALCSFVD